MTERTCRKFTAAEDALLKRFWPTAVSDKRLVAIFGRHRGVIYAHARKVMAMPSRTAARDGASVDLIQQIGAAP